MNFRPGSRATCARFALRSPLYLIDLSEYERAREELNAIRHRDKLPPADRAGILRAHAQITPGELKEEEASQL